MQGILQGKRSGLQMTIDAWASEAEQFREQMAELTKKLNAHAHERKEDLKNDKEGPLPESYFNEFLVQAKLEPALFTRFYAYARERNLNRSSALKEIIATHPKIKKIR